MLSVRLSVSRNLNNMIRSLSLLLLAFFAGNTFADEAVKPIHTNYGSSVVQWFLSTFLILIIIFVLAYLLKKTKFVKSTSSKLSIVSQIYLGPKQRVAIVQVGNRQVLLGVTPTSINFLTDVENTKEKFEKLMQDSKEQSADDISKSDK